MFPAFVYHHTTGKPLKTINFPLNLQSFPLLSMEMKANNSMHSFLLKDEKDNYNFLTKIKIPSTFLDTFEQSSSYLKIIQNVLEQKREKEKRRPNNSQIMNGIKNISV